METSPLWWSSTLRPSGMSCSPPSTWRCSTRPGSTTAITSLSRSWPWAGVSGSPEHGAASRRSQENDDVFMGASSAFAASDGTTTRVLRPITGLQDIRHPASFRKCSLLTRSASDVLDLGHQRRSRPHAPVPPQLSSTFSLSQLSVTGLPTSCKLATSRRPCPDLVASSRFKVLTESPNLSHKSKTSTTRASRPPHRNQNRCACGPLRPQVLLRQATTCQMLVPNAETGGGTADVRLGRRRPIRG